MFSYDIFQVTEVEAWVTGMSLSLSPLAVVSIKAYLSDLGATKLDELAGMTDEHVADLLELLPFLKRSRFTAALEQYRPVHPSTLFMHARAIHVHSSHLLQSFGSPF